MWRLKRIQLFRSWILREGIVLMGIKRPSICTPTLLILCADEFPWIRLPIWIEGRGRLYYYYYEVTVAQEVPRGSLSYKLSRLPWCPWEPLGWEGTSQPKAHINLSKFLGSHYILSPAHISDFCLENCNICTKHRRLQYLLQQLHCISCFCSLSCHRLFAHSR